MTHGSRDKDRNPPPSPSAPATQPSPPARPEDLFRAEKERALGARDSQHARLLAEAKAAFDKLMAEGQAARKSGRPRKHPLPPLKTSSARPRPADAPIAKPAPAPPAKTAAAKPAKVEHMAKRAPAAKHAPATKREARTAKPRASRPASKSKPKAKRSGRR